MSSGAHTGCLVACFSGTGNSVFAEVFPGAAQVVYLI